MTIEQIQKDIENCGLSQWFSNKGLHSVYEEWENGYSYFISTGVTLFNSQILEEHHGISLEAIQVLIS